MPLFTPYFSLDSSAFRVGNGGRLRCRMGASGIGIYVMLLSHLRDCRDCRAPLDYDMLAFDLHEDAAAVRRVVEDFGLFDIDRSSGTFTSSVLTTVRGMLSDDASAAGVGPVRTVRQRRVRSSGETYRRAVRRLAEDNALPPAEEEAPAEGDAEPAEEAPTSSENEITPAEGEHPFAEEANATGAFVPTSIAAEDEPAEVKHESADAEGTPAEVEDQPAEEANATGDFTDVRSPRTEEKRKEQNKKPHTPIVPFPQSGKGTRASHPAAAVVGEREEDAASAEGDEESVVGSPRFVSSAAADADAPPCAASPTVLGAPAQTLDPHPSPDTAKADTSAENGKTSAEKTKTSVPNSQPNTLTTSEAPAHPNPDTANPNERDTLPSGKMQNGESSVPNGKSSAENKEMSTNHSQPNPLTASEKTTHPNPDTANRTTSVPNGQTSAENKEMSTNHSQPNPLTASEKTTHPSPDTENGRTSVPNGESSAEKMETSLPNSQPNPLTTSEETAHPQTLDPHPSPDAAKADTSAEYMEMSTNHSQPNTLTTSEKSDEAGRGEEGAGEPFVPPTANEVRRFAETLHHPEFDAEWFVAYYTERHWRRHNGRPVVSWQTTARYWLDHPLRVARHLLDHRPAASPVSVGVGGPSAVVVPAAGTTAAKPVAGSASSPSTGTPPVCTGGLSPRASASSPHSGTPHVGSLSLPAPTPLQQSRLSDLKGMVLHLFADAPAAAPTSATAAPAVPAAETDVSASAPTPATAASPSVRPARILSPAEAAQVIAQQTLAAAEAEAVPRIGERRATDSEEEARVGEISPTDAAKAIDAQVLSPADAEESVRACDNSTDEDEEDALNGHDSTTDAAKDIDAQVLSPADAKEYVRACDNSTTDTAKDIDAQAFSPADAKEDIAALPFSADKGRWGVRSPRGPDPPTGDGHDSTDAGNDFADAENHFTAQPSNFSADRHSPAAVGTARTAVGTALAADSPIFPADECRPLHTFTEKHPYLNPSFHEPHPFLRLHPPSFGGFGCTFRVQSVQPPFGRPFLGRFVDIRPACTVGSRPLRPRLTLCRTARGRCRPEHPDRERTNPATAVERSANAVEHDAQCAKNADFIDADPVHGHQTERNEPEYPADGRKRHDSAPEHAANAAERSANTVSTPADAAEHGAQCAKNADFIDADPACGHKIERNAAERSANAVSPLADAGEHADRGRKRHEHAPEHRADECPDPAYDPDAGQRVLRSAAHRRAVRAEREACCGALRHLAHCCVAF